MELALNKKKNGAINYRTKDGWFPQEIHFGIKPTRKKIFFLGKKER
jgi:hypothetical protein